jgi:hypothetical protein
MLIKKDNNKNETNVYIVRRKLEMTILSCEDLVKQKRNLISSVRRLFSKCP